MAKARNILFIMYDQLRRDYLSCYGHPHLETPHMDRLASMGMRFDRAYIQSPVCGSSRMSTYTGRYVHSHGATWNGIPLKVGEMTMGDHLRKAGMECYLVGKTHMVPDREGMARLGLSPESIIGARVSECGFDVVERDDGVNPDGPDGRYDSKAAEHYNAYLRSRGYDSDNPWHDYANSAIGEQDDVLSGWFLKNAAHPANIEEQDSETPYFTRRAMEFLETADQPWCCHLSYIKPHWPYIVPEPYASMYGAQHVLPQVATQDEFDNAHPVLKTMMKGVIGSSFSRPEVRNAVIPAYMGLIKQADDQLGVLLDWMERSGRIEDTMIVLTSDHGDFLGDHWLGEKMFFHDVSTRVPLIVYDPSPAADATRGTVCDALIEAIDLAPTFVEVAGAEVPDHILEGHSLCPILHGEAQELARSYVICEVDFSGAPFGDALKADMRSSMGFMIANTKWKMVHFEDGNPPVLFDLENDPDELVDLGGDPDYADVLDEMYDQLADWARRPSQRTTVSKKGLAEMRVKTRRLGVTIGAWDEADYPDEFTAKYRGIKARPFQQIVKERGDRQS
ncbi:sulfatase-like hydrolase/transferase [Fluviibacterium sp. DFM31]|uniref:Sulfatase-like hydrolase/transferase n=1 Tax=Meridianimarinicoccus marinus TaxID=3231483 RepID=A0ABV3LBL7_9RHOB